MTYRVVFSPGAEDDLDDLEEYLAVRFSEANARRYIQRIVSYCLGLASAPHRGSRRDDIRMGLRTVGFERRVTIAFQIDETTILVLGVSCGGRRIERMVE